MAVAMASTARLGMGSIDGEVERPMTRVSVLRRKSSRGGKDSGQCSSWCFLYGSRASLVTSSRQERPPATRERWARRRAVVLRDEGMRMSSFFYFVAEEVRGLALGCGCWTGPGFWWAVLVGLAEQVRSR
jgi:hypothetical protein